MKPLTAIFFLLGMASVCREVHAQEDISWTDQAEQRLDRDENSAIPSALFEELQELENHPLNLNTASAEEMEYAGIFTRFQIRMIIEYRDRYGELFSVYELASIRGFRPGRLKEISRFITVEPGKRKGQKKRGTNNILLFMGRTYPLAAGYQTPQKGAKLPQYGGSPWKTSLRVKVAKGKRVRSGLAYEKDPGEKGFTGTRPEYLTGFIQYRGSRIIKQCILGSYRLQNGLGLVHGTDQFTAPGVSHARVLKLSTLKPYAGLSESGSLHGLACSLNLNPVKLSFWSSLKFLDVSAGKLPLKREDVNWETHFRESGLHRTSTEIGGRGLGYLGNAGIQAGLTHKTFFAGAQFSLVGSGLRKKGADSLQSNTKPTLHHSVSIFWKWQPGSLEIFGEYSPGRTETSAILTGIRYHLNDFLSGGILAHWYGPSHRETFASAYGSGSHIYNEKGLMLHVHTEPARTFVADMAAELFWYPEPRSMTRVPSSAFRFKLSLQSSSQERFSWRIKMIKKIWQTTPLNAQAGYRLMVQQNLARIDGRLVFKATEKFQWQTRLVASWQAQVRSIKGYAAMLQTRHHLLGKLSIATQFVIFSAPSWDHRIYLFEPGLYRHFSFPVYYGKGQKLSLVFSLKSGNRISLEGKFSKLIYYDRHQIGTGNGLLGGNAKSEVGIQLGLKL